MFVERVFGFTRRASGRERAQHRHPAAAVVAGRPAQPGPAVADLGSASSSACGSSALSSSISSLHRNHIPSEWGKFYPDLLGLGDARRVDRAVPDPVLSDAAARADRLDGGGARDRRQGEPEMTRAAPLRDRRRFSTRRTRSSRRRGSCATRASRAVEAYTPLPGRRARRGRCVPAGGVWLPLVMFAGAVFGAVLGLFHPMAGTRRWTIRSMSADGPTTAGRLSSSSAFEIHAAVRGRRRVFRLAGRLPSAAALPPDLRSRRFRARLARPLRSVRRGARPAVSSRDCIRRDPRAPRRRARSTRSRREAARAHRRSPLSAIGAGGVLRQHGEPAEAAAVTSCRTAPSANWPALPPPGIVARDDKPAPAAAGDAGAAASAASERFDIYLRAVPRPCRRRPRHDRPARLSARRPPIYIERLRDAPVAAFLRRHHQWLWRHVSLRGARRAAGPLGDRRLYPGVAGQRDGEALPMCRRISGRTCNDPAARLDAAQPRRCLRPSSIGVVGCVVGVDHRCRRLSSAPGLCAYLFWLGLPLGGVTLVLVHDLTGGEWMATARPALDAAIATMPLATLAGIPAFIGLRQPLQLDASGAGTSPTSFI